MLELLNKLESIVGKNGIVKGADLRQRAASLTDASSHAALCLVRPVSVLELSAVLACCNVNGQKVVVQGGMSGLVDGATAAVDEVAVSLERLVSPVVIDTVNRTALVSAGTTIQELQEAAAKEELLFAVDWGARGSATIGGAIATNAGGNSVLRYGMMREQVLGLEAVLMDGTVVSSMNHMLKNNSGFDLKQLFIGSEGTLGVVATAVVRLRPAPTTSQTALLAVADFASVVSILWELDRGFGGALSAFEVMWQDHYEGVVAAGNHAKVLPFGHAFYVLVEMISGTSAGDDEFTEVLGRTIDTGLAIDAAVSTSLAQREAMWAIREDIDTLFEILNPPIPFDVSLPIGDMEAYVAAATRDVMAEFPAARRAVFGHIGDGNLHFCWSLGGGCAADKNRLCELVYLRLEEFQGAVSAEHGIGVSKRSFLPLARNRTEILWMERLKRLFDPNNLLNAGRVIDLDNR